MLIHRDTVCCSRHGSQYDARTNVVKTGRAEVAITSEHFEQVEGEVRVVLSSPVTALLIRGGPPNFGSGQESWVFPRSL